MVDFFLNVNLVFITFFRFTEDENCLCKSVKIREHRLQNLILISKRAVRYLMFENLQAVIFFRIHFACSTAFLA